MNAMTFSDHETRLFDMGGSFIAIHQGMVCIEDLLKLRSGGIVRCHGNPNDVIRVLPFDGGPIGCVAGWISEDDQ